MADKNAAAIEVKVREVPANACTLSLGDFQLGDNGDDAKSAPIEMLARTGKPIDHWFFGKVVHDLSGMKLHKRRLPIDYAHDDKEVIGYLNKFETDSGDLVAKGALVPFGENDRATEVIYKAKNGVPYEASIFFGGDGLKFEDVDKDTEVEVNGRKLKGPLMVVREWPLRGVAVVPYGADMRTKSKLAANEKYVAAIVSKEPTEMADEPKKDAELEAEQTPPADSVETDPKPAEGAAEDQAAPVDAEPVEATEPDAASDAVDAGEPKPEAKPDAEPAEQSAGAKFLADFGPQGGVWFAEGRTYEEAQALHRAAQAEELEKLRAENAELKAQGPRPNADRGVDEPVDFQPAPDDKGAKPLRQKADEIQKKAHIGPTAANLAAVIQHVNS